MCQTCENEYRLSGNLCVACPSNCKTCAVGGCSSCNTGSALISGSCVACTSTGSGGSAGCTACFSVSSSLRCTSCDNGYYLTAGHVCDACTNKYANSALCTSTALVQCLNDFDATLSNRFYKINNQCIANANNCKTMKDNTGKCS